MGRIGFFFLTFSPDEGAAITTKTPPIKVSGCMKKKHLFLYYIHVLWLLVQINIFYHLSNKKPFAHFFHLANQDNLVKWSSQVYLMRTQLV